MSKNQIFDGFVWGRGEILCPFFYENKDRYWGMVDFSVDVQRHLEKMRHFSKLSIFKLENL